MFTLNKLLKIALPVTTVTSATILTAWLISRSPELLNQEQDKDLILDDFQEDREEFKEQTFSEQSDEAPEGVAEDENDIEEEAKDGGPSKPKDAQEQIDLEKVLNEVQNLPKILSGGEETKEGRFTLPPKLSSKEAGQPEREGKEINRPSQEESQSPSDLSLSPKANPDSVSENSEIGGDKAKESEASLPSEREKGVAGEQDLQVPEESGREERQEESLADHAQTESREEATSKGELGAESAQDPKKDSQALSGSESDSENDSEASGEDASQLREEKADGYESVGQEGQRQQNSERGEKGNVDGNSNRTNVDLSELERLEQALLSTDEELGLALSRD